MIHRFGLVFKFHSGTPRSYNLVMKQAACSLLLVLGSTSASRVWAQTLETDREVVQVVEHFVELTSQLRLYALEHYVTTDANVIVARSTKSGFVNRVLAADEWRSEMERGLTPVPFREALSNFDVFVASGALAVVRADFKIARDDRAVSSGVNIFTLTSPYPSAIGVEE